MPVLVKAILFTITGPQICDGQFTKFDIHIYLYIYNFGIHAHDDYMLEIGYAIQ